jgi:hypothetical protein
MGRVPIGLQWAQKWAISIKNQYQKPELLIRWPSPGIGIDAVEPF